MNFRNIKKENLRALNDQLRAELPGPSDDEILDQNFKKIDAFSNVSFLAMSDQTYELSVDDAQKINGRKFLMVEITKENLPHIYQLLRNRAPEETVDDIFEKNLAKIDFPPPLPPKERNDFLTRNGIPRDNEIQPQMNTMINSFEKRGNLI